MPRTINRRVQLHAGSIPSAD